MPTRALGALLAAVATIAFVVSIVSGAWWDGHPRVDGRVFTAKAVHIGLLGGEGCNTGGTGECQPLALGTTFTTVAYGELGGLALTGLFALLVAVAALRISEGRKRLAKIAMVLAALAAAGALALIVLGPQIKTTQRVEPPIGWGLLVFGGGIVAMLGASLATLRVEREPLRLKSPPRAPNEPAFDVREVLRDGQGLRPSGPLPAGANLPGPSGPLGAPHGAPRGAPLFEAAPQLRPLYDVQGAAPMPAAPHLPERAPTPVPRASAHAIAGLDEPDLVVPGPHGPFSAPQAYAAPNAVPTPQPFGASVPTPQPFGAPPAGPRSKPPTAAPPPPGSRSKPASMAPPPSPTPPAFGAARPGSPSSAPFGAPGSPSSAPFGAPRTGSPSSAPFGAPRPGSPSKPPPFATPSVAPPADPLAATMPAPARVAPPPRPPKISVPPPRAVARDQVPHPTPTPSIITSAAKPGSSGASAAPSSPAPSAPSSPASSAPSSVASPARSSAVSSAPSSPASSAPSSPAPNAPAPRPSQPTLAHAVPPMPVIDTPPPQLVRAATENDDRLETGMRDTEYITAVEIDHEAKAKYEEQRRQAAAGRAETSELAEPPPPSSPAQAGTHGEAPADDTDAIETSARERMDSVGDEVAPPPAQAPTQRPSQPGASPASRASEPADSAAPRPSRPAPSPALRASQPVIPNIPPIAPTPIVPAASPTAALANASGTVNYSTAPASLPPPKTATLPATGPTPACPQCESPMAWVEEHLRFYCKSCRMYF